MVARELTKHCFHRILRCLCSFAVDAQLLNRCLASTYKYYPKGFHSAHAAVAKPTYAPDSSSPIEDRFIAEALKIPAIGPLQTPTLERVLL